MKKYFVKYSYKTYKDEVKIGTVFLTTDDECDIEECWNMFKSDNTTEYVIDYTLIDIVPL